MNDLPIKHYSSIELIDLAAMLTAASIPKDARCGGGERAQFLPMSLHDNQQEKICTKASQSAHQLPLR